MGGTGWIRNLSVRVPWHDRGWDGHICNNPITNSSCLALKLVAENRNDDLEQSLHGKPFDDLTSEQLPPCIRTSASFLSPHPQSFQSVMAYSKWSKDHKHILPRTVHVPAWGATAIPYRWMLKDSGFEIANSLELDANLDREPDAPAWLANTSWIQGFGNQEALLNAFAAPLIEEESLVLFYATRTPLCDDERRVLLGAALLGKKHELTEYPYAEDANSAIQAMVWERPLQHTLRSAPDQDGYVGGFVMPYQALQHALEQRQELNPTDYVAFVPDDARAQFSYGSEHVSHGATASALLAARNALERTAEILDGPWDRYIAWIDERLGRLWTLQGPAPGLGVVMSALHPGFNGTLFAMALADELEANADPWPVIEEIFAGKRQPPPGSPQITGMLKKRWARVVGESAAYDRLKLLARLELTKEQTERALEFDAASILKNPYTLFEEDRSSIGPISFEAIDRGLYPGKEVRNAHPLPQSCSPQLSEYDNELRLRAACVEILENSTGQGHTYLPIDQLSAAVAGLQVVYPIPLDADTVDICRDDFAPPVTVDGTGEQLSVQLDRYVAGGKLITEAILERLKQSDDGVVVDWRALLDEKFGAFAPADLDEERAREEKAKALNRLAASRVAVLIGPAGTGKTSVLQLLLDQTKIVGTRVKLLAPTGKARVRLGMETGRREQVQTVAQFLIGHRFDPETGRYFTDAQAPKIEATTCIVDESSMLTEDMLSAIIESLPRNCRLILVGDPYQLPPIGAGCPFVDIIEFLKRQHGDRGVGELTTPRRQLDEFTEEIADKTPALARADVQLAAIFSGRPLPPGEDEIVVDAIKEEDSDTVKYRQWDSLKDLSTLVESVIAEELGCEQAEIVSAFEASLGAKRNEKGYLNFEQGCADSAERWQILSVNKNIPGGSVFLNRRVKERLRGERLKQAIDSNRVPQFKPWWRTIKPRGPEQITYGDKVICVRNHRRKPYIYGSGDGEAEFLANGEIGLITGQNRYDKKNPTFTHLELAGRADRNFSFRRSDFSEDGSPYLELAYAISVHKAQGSEFGSVILVLPAHSRLLSREMIYTALTRQKKRIWILHQGSFDTHISLRRYMYSDIAARFTNLLRKPRPMPVRLPSEIPKGLFGSQRKFLEEKLIHRTLRGEMVSSKNELAIANILYALEQEGLLTYQVEPLLPFDDGKGRWADFLIKAGDNHWYWEHCGMMADEQYRKRWNRKKELYLNNGYSVRNDENPNGRLIVTEDGPDQGLDSQFIEQLARTLIRA